MKSHVILALLVLTGCGDALHDEAEAEPSPRKTFYAHGAMNIRDRPTTTSSRVVGKLKRGDEVIAGLRDAEGWAQIFVADTVAGYVYLASSNIREEAPREVPAFRELGPCAGKAREVFQTMNRGPDYQETVRSSSYTQVNWVYEAGSGRVVIGFGFGPALVGCDIVSANNIR